jgi:hypothetical protein
MKTVIDEGARSGVLAQWSGGRAEVFMYHASHNRLAIRILPKDPGDTRMLYIVGAGCARIAGPFDWDDAQLEIRHIAEPQYRCLITDPAAGFELRCTAATVAMGSIDDHDASFEHFFDDGARATH